MIYLSNSEAATAALAARLAPLLGAGDIVTLRGDLGSGKTVFARALVRALCGDMALEVPSPTFTLVQTYEAPACEIWHFDLYRLEHAAEIYELGWEEALGRALILAEWPERLGPLAPPDRLTLMFESVPDRPEMRRIVISPEGGWAQKTQALELLADQRTGER